MGILKTAIGVAIGIAFAAAIGLAVIAGVRSHDRHQADTIARAEATKALAVQGCAIRGAKISGAVHNASRFEFVDVRVTVELHDIAGDRLEPVTINLPLAYADDDTGFSTPVSLPPTARVSSVSVTGRIP